ncbi:type VI secretion system Vgr family protein [Vibrio panuliri]|uniref:Type IV secretion protein Rhs n=1 Tax=Vibrio panuliri TaxID=1381081 RepID=A0ABX3FR37_9VIBR|nr:type VI secretion system tip protein VgrG [Vibrio panuliri]KAB1457961.1 type VI secretion system tip protein VgrG [Vibrio panuliri]OLQ96400.1 type IV secretion protein Rhs [Vibrio panuliri]
MAKLTFTLTVEGLPQDTFVVTGYQGKESVSQSMFEQTLPCYGFRYHIDLGSRQQGISAQQVVDHSAMLTIKVNGDPVQYVHGVVRQFSQGEIGHHHTLYSLTLVPALERLSLRQNSRIFQQKTVPEIIAILLQEMGIEDFSFAMTGTSAMREFCVQYRETDLAFVHRLSAEEGLCYYIEQTDVKHSVVFVDDTSLVTKFSEPIIHNSLSGGVTDQPYISKFSITHQVEPSRLEMKDYSFKKPSYGFVQQQIGSDLSSQHDQYEHYDYPGRYKEDGTGKTFSQYRLEYLRRESHVAEGKSNHVALQAGVKFDLIENLDTDANRDWFVVEVIHYGSQPQALEEEGTHGATTYHNQFKVIPANLNWRSQPQPKPRVDGPMIALVVGPEGEEIYCDEHGRVKLHFPWDRYSAGNEQSSCWVRVSQGWAGGQYGFMAIPRIGHEVIVEFLNGDPDQPIVTGRTYHATNTPPYPLPDHKTKTVLRSETHQGEGFNELSFEDQSESEKVYLHAQKDFDVDILNDHTTHIKHDKHLLVENDRFTQIEHNQHLVVEGESCSKVTQDNTVVVEGSLHQKTANLESLDAGMEVHLQSGAKVVIEAGGEQTFKVGGNFVKVDASGVTITGANINLNSGGGAGSGSGFGGKIAALPNGVESPPPPLSVTPNFADAILRSAQIGMYIVPICGQQADGSCTLGEECRCKK